MSDMDRWGYRMQEWEPDEGEDAEEGEYAIDYQCLTCWDFTDTEACEVCGEPVCTDCMATGEHWHGRG